MVAIFDGRYGPYVKHGKINVTIPKDQVIESVRLEDAVQWIQDKAEKKGIKLGAKKKKTTKKKTTAKKKSKTKKSAGKKKKSTTKKSA